MQLAGARALVTGAGGGIGRAVVAELVRAGAAVLMVDRDQRAMDAALDELTGARQSVALRAVDITSAEERAALCDLARSWRGGINVLVNNAGLNPFGLYEELRPQQIDLALAVNLQAPMHLCLALLPHLRTQAPAAIVNTGSVFGAIGYPGYVAYSTTKFALRGFTESLRRELRGSGVAVQYFAPRATRTPINSSAVEQMNRVLGVTMDTPERVARELVTLIRSGQHSAVVGWPEKLFVRINALLPSLVDRSIRGQLPVIERYARAASRAARPVPHLLAQSLDVRRQTP
jgi:short-subunit dehydrogenase